MKFKFVNNDGDGATEEVTLAGKTSVGDYLNMRLCTDWEDDYSARLNRDEVDDSTTISDGARLSVTHRKQDGN